MKNQTLSNFHCPHCRLLLLSKSYPFFITSFRYHFVYEPLPDSHPDSLHFSPFSWLSTIQRPWNPSIYFSVILLSYCRRLGGKDNSPFSCLKTSALLTEDSLEEGTITFERNQKPHASKKLCAKTQQHLTIELSKRVTGPVCSAADQPSHGSSRDNTPAPSPGQRAERKPALLLLTLLRPLALSAGLATHRPSEASEGGCPGHGSPHARTLPPTSPL